jgi:hypothetical protein
LSGILGAPAYCLTDLACGIYGTCHSPGIHHSFISSLWLPPRYCMFSFTRPLCSIFRTSLLFYLLCPTLMLFRSTLLCTILIFCFPFQAMHSNNSSISTHVFSYWFFSTKINLDSYFSSSSKPLNLAPTFSKVEEHIGVGAQHIS